MFLPALTKLFRRLSMRRAAAPRQHPAASAGEPNEHRRSLRASRAERLRSLEAMVGQRTGELELRYVELVESLSTASGELVEAARGASFDPPPWPGGIERTLEIKVSETREITLRLQSQQPLREDGEGSLTIRPYRDGGRSEEQP